jgi:DNA-binding transcriptional ArsR family regulator
VNTNVLAADHPEEQISKLLSLIGQPARIQILLIIGAQEACVCHLEAALGMRQASISQHLMVLRKAGLVSAQRDGRNIFYRLTHPEVIDVLRQAAQLTASSPEALRALTARPVQNCPCPQCNPGIDPNLTCGKIKRVVRS